MKKEDTPLRKRRRRYEESHREERKEKSKVWGTSIDRELAEEIDSFLEQHNIKKGELIYVGYKALQSQYGPNTTKK